jgi:hypothetical protein
VSRAKMQKGRKYRTVKSSGAECGCSVASTFSRIAYRLFGKRPQFKVLPTIQGASHLISVRRSGFRGRRSYDLPGSSDQLVLRFLCWQKAFACCFKIPLIYQNLYSALVHECREFSISERYVFFC